VEKLDIFQYVQLQYLTFVNKVIMQIICFEGSVESVYCVPDITKIGQCL